MDEQKLKTEQPTGAEVYDISGGTPVLGEVPHEQVQQAIESGQFQLPANRQVSVISPDGELGSIPPEQAAEAFKAGYKYASPNQAEYGGATGQLAAAALGAADTATFGVAGPILDTVAGLLGAKDPTSERLAIAQENPMSRMAGQVTGLLLPGGAGALMGKAGEAAAAGINTATAAGRVGSAATKAAVENMIFAGSDEVAKVFMHDPNQSIESAMANVGMATALGGGIGGAFGAVPELWKMSGGKLMQNGLDGVKMATEGKPTAELAKLGIATAPEVEVALGNSPVARNAFQSLMQADTRAANTLRKAVDEFDVALSDSAARTLGRTADEVADISTAKVGEAVKSALDDGIMKRYEPLAKSYEALEAKFGTAVIAPEIRDVAANKLQQLIVDEGLLKSKAAQPMLKVVVEALEDLPKQANAQDLRLLVQNLKAGNPFGKEGYQIAKKVTGILDEAMDGTLAGAADLGGVGAEFKATQAGYRELRGIMSDLNDYLHAGKVRGSESFVKAIKDMDAETIAARLSKEKVGLRETLEKNFPEVAQQIKQFQYDSILDKARVGDNIDVKKLLKAIDKLEPETRASLFKPEQMEALQSIQSLRDRIPKNINPSGTARTVEALMSMPAATIAGSLLGGGTGGIMALIGAGLLKEGRDAGKLAMLRFLASDAPTNAAAFKQAMGMASAVEKGERALNNSVKAVFEPKNGTAVKVPDTKPMMELVDKFEADPEKFLSLGADLGHYMPEHAAALGAAAVRNVRYLASLKPSTAPVGPLDAARQVSSTEEAKYDRALQIAQAPLIILEGVQAGRINPQDLQHLHQMYPALAASMEKKLIEQMIEAKGKGKAIPYKTQMGLSAFMGQPLSTSLQPQSIQAAQPQNASMPPPMQGKPVRKTSGLPKLGTAYQTPMQSRQKHREQ